VVRGVQHLDSPHHGERLAGARTRLGSSSLTCRGRDVLKDNLALNCFVLSLLWREDRRAIDGAPNLRSIVACLAMTTI
jgi:hypothetical protein